MVIYKVRIVKLERWVAPADVQAVGKMEAASRAVYVRKAANAVVRHDCGMSLRKSMCVQVAVWHSSCVKRHRWGIAKHCQPLASGAVWRPLYATLLLLVCYTGKSFTLVRRVTFTRDVMWSFSATSHSTTSHAARHRARETRASGNTSNDFFMYVTCNALQCARESAKRHVMWADRQTNQRQDSMQLQSRMLRLGDTLISCCFSFWLLGQPAVTLNNEKSGREHVQAQIEVQLI